MTTYDLIIIGAGPGGYETAAEAAAKGLSTLLVEKDSLGGTCLNRGCIPTKALCASAARLLSLKDDEKFGIHINSYDADFSLAKKRAEEVVDSLKEGVEELLCKVVTIKGEAKFTSTNTIAVGDEEFSADKIIVATGSRPAQLRVEGALYAISSDQFLQLNKLPESLIIIGGGVIGLEFASIASAFGTKVTVLEYCPEILPGFDSDIAKRLRSSLEKRGIDIIVGAKVSSISEDHTVSYERKNKQASVGADMVLAAVGRSAVIPEGAAEVGIEISERGFIKVDNEFKTSVEGVYAIGDVNGVCMLAHAASAQGRVVLGEKIDLSLVPSVVFTVPELAMVRRREGQSIKIPFSANSKAVASGEAQGLLKVDFDTDTKELLGCTVLGTHAADLVATASVAIFANLTLEQFGNQLIHAHPGLSELFALAAKSI